MMSAMPLSDYAAGVAQKSATDLYRCLGLEKGYKPAEQHALMNVIFDVYKGYGDEAADQKVVALRAAIAKIRGKGIALPARMKLYTSNLATYQNIAFQRGISGDQETVICLGGKMTTPMQLPVGIATMVSGMGSDVSAFMAAVCVHELGHVLHEIADPEFFWSAAANEQAPSNLVAQISMYANNNKKEYVAECFTGCIYGMKTQFGQAVMDKYDEYHGPAGV
jgi:hypothetical protein